MPKLPSPPSLERLRASRPVSVLLPAGTIVGRIFFADGEYPTRWNSFRQYGPTDARFDHHLPDEKGGACVNGDRSIVYLAGTEAPGPLAVCLAEVFQATRRIDVHRGAPHFTLYRLARPVRLLDLRGVWITRAGASAAIATGPKSVARAWSRAFHTAFEDIDGVTYRSSMGGNANAYALYERALDAVPAEPAFLRALAEPAFMSYVMRAADDIWYEVLPPGEI